MRTRNQTFNRRRLLAASAAGSGSAALLAACSSRGASRAANTAASTTSGAPQRGGTFTGYWNANPPALDPQFFATGATTSFACAVMSGLFRFKIGTDLQVGLNHDLENDLATGAESPDGVTWTFKLRPDATFHNIPPVNGHAVEAEDVKATFVRGVTSPQNPNRGPISMIDAAQIETPDAHTVILKLKYAYAPFANLMGSVQYGPVYPREVSSGGYDPSKQMIGAGPFVFESYTPDVGLSLKRNPNYYEKGQPYVDGVKHAIIPNTAQQLAQFTGGNLSILHLAQKDIDSAKKSVPNAQVIKAIGGGNHPIYFQLGDSSSPFQDERLRRAVSMALDRETIGKTFDNNEYQLCFAVNLSMGKWALTFDQLDPSVQQYYKFNLTQAKQLVEQAGASNLNLKVAYPAHAFETDFDSYAQTLFSMLSALPWKPTLIPLDYNKDYLNGGKGYLYGYFPSDTIVISGTNPFGETDQYLYQYWYSSSPGNVSHLHDSALDGMIDKARGLVDAEARRKAYLGVQSYLAGKVYPAGGIPLGYAYTMVRPEVQNFSYVPESNSDGRSWRTLWIKQ